MSGNARFHNKYHGANHHTVPTDGVVDSALDPIASHDYPFKGDMVVNGLLSACNNLTKVFSDPLKLDTVPYYSEPPTGWHVLRDSTFIDGHLTITGNVSATGKLTYFDTQVYVTSATEINIAANNTNGKDTALTVDQSGTNSVVHFKDSGRSAFLITGHDDDNPGWIGINLNAITPNTPSQRVTIVGSISTVPDSSEIADQINGQADPGMSGSHYIEGQLHVNDKTFLDQTYIDTTDGNLVVSGSNTFDVDVPSDFETHVTMDQVTIDTTDGNFLVNGSNTIHLSSQAGTEIHNYLDIHANDLNGVKGGVKIKSATFQNQSGNKFHVENTFVHLDGDRYFHGGDTVIDIGQGIFGATLSGEGGILFDLDGAIPGTSWQEDFSFSVKGQTYLADTWIDTSADLSNNGTKRFVVGPKAVADDTILGSERGIEYHAMFNTGVQFSSGALFEDHTGFSAPGKIFDFSAGEKVNSEILVHFKDDLIMTETNHTLSAHGRVDIDGNTRIGDGRDKLLTVTAEVDSNILPDANTWNLGEANEAHHWGDVYSLRGLFSNHVGINTHIPNKELTVVGETSATGHVRFDTSLDVDGFTSLDETHIDTTDGHFVVSGSNDVYIGTEEDAVDVFQKGDWTIESGDLYLENKLIHLLNDNTFLEFTPNIIDLQVGGKQILRASQSQEDEQEPAQLTIGDSHSAIDVHFEKDVNIYFRNMLSGAEGWFESLTAQNFFQVSELSAYGDTDIVDGDLTIKDGPDASTTGSIYLCAGNIYLDTGSTVDGRDISADGERLDSAYTTTQTYSSDWQDAYSWIDTNGATSTRSYNDSRYVNLTGDEMTGDLVVPSLTATADVHIGGNLNVVGTAVISGGNVQLGDAANDNVIFGADVDSDIIPDKDEQYDLGSASQKWQDVHTVNVKAIGDVEWSGGSSDKANEAITEVNTSSGNWNRTYTDVSTTSSNWDTAHSWVNTNGTTSTRSYNDTRYVNVTGDTMTGTLNVPVVSAQSLSADNLTLSDDSLHFQGGGAIKGDADGNILIDSGTLRVTTLSALSSYVDVIDIKVRELSGYDIIDGDVSVDGDIEVTDITATGNIDATGSVTWSGGDSTGTNTVVTKVTNSQDDWDDTYNHLFAASSNWQDTYAHVYNVSSNWTSPSDAIVSSSSANWDETYTTYSTNSANYFNTATNQIGGTLTVTGGISAYDGGVSATNMTVYELRGRPQAVYNSGGTEGVAFMVEGMEGVWSVFNGNYSLSGTNYNNRSSSYTGGNVYIHEEFSNLSHASSGVLLAKGIVAGSQNLNNLGSQLEWGFVQIAANKTEWITNGLPVETGGTAGGWTGNHFYPAYTGNQGTINLGFGLLVDTYNSRVYDEIRDYFNTEYSISIPSITNSGTNNVAGNMNSGSEPFRDDGENINTGGWTTAEWTNLAAFYTRDQGDAPKGTQLNGDNAVHSNSNIGVKFIDTYNPTGGTNTTPELAVTAGNNHNWNPGTVKDRFPDFRITFDTISHYEDDIRLTPYTRLDGRDISVDGTYVDIVSAKHDDWTSTHSQVQSLSDGWNTGATIDTIMQNSSANWDNTYTDVSANSADWDTSYSRSTDVANTSANWDNVYSDVSNTSASWDSSYTTVNSNSAYWLDTRPGLDQTYSGDLLTITNKVSTTEAYVKSLTAEKTTYLDVTSGLTMPVGKNIYVRDGILDVDGDIQVRDGDLKISESIVHYLDENTQVRFEPDRLTFRCHDVRFFTINEDPGADEDYVSIGGEADGNRIDFKMYAADISEPLVINARGDTGLVTFGYSTVLGTDSNDTVTFNADVNSNIIPDAPVTGPSNVTGHSLGTSSQGWNALYVKDLHFRDTARKDSNVAPLTATGDYIVVTVNGTERAIRLWDFQ